MFWLILCTISATGIFVLFKVIDKTNTALFNAIIVNYIVAAGFGYWLTGGFDIESVVKSDWFIQSAVIGVLFIIMFFIIGLSSKKVGISITSVAGKMSVVIPMTFAIIAFNEDYGIIKVSGILLALFAVTLSVYKKPDKKGNFKFVLIFLPVILFLGMGIVDSAVIHSKEIYVTDDLASVFSATVFAFALITGLLVSITRPKVFKNFGSGKVWGYGLALGIANFGSIYLMIRALNSGVFQNSVVYGIVNIGIVSLSVIIGTLFFKEKLSRINYIGIVLSIFAIALLTMADI